MRLRKRGFYHYESWRLASSCCSDFPEKSGGDDGDGGGICLELLASTRPKEKTASASALTPRQGESRRPAVGSGVKTRVRTNVDENPAQARIFKPRPPTPRK